MAARPGGTAGEAVVQWARKPAARGGHGAVTLMQTKTAAFIRRIRLFWAAYNYLFLAVTLGLVLFQRPDLRAGQGLTEVLAAVALYAGMYWYGFAWLVSPGSMEYWKAPGERDPVSFRRAQARRLLFWALALGAITLLVGIDHDFAGMYWAAFGIAIGTFRWPWNVPTAALPVGLVLYLWGIVPRGATLQDWLGFGALALNIAGYVAICVMVSVLIYERYRRDKLFSDLTAAHGDLRAANTRLAETADQERELAVLRERGRLARELHDTLGHALVLTNVKLEAISRLMTVDQERAAHEIGVTQGVVRDAMAELRAALAELRSPISRGEPVGFALARLAREAGDRARWQVDCAVSDATGRWPEAVQTALLRVGAEAIANAERHARARQVVLVVAEDAGCAVVRLADDGVGLPAGLCAPANAATSPPGHFGISGMRERAVALGGTLCLAAHQPRGTTVEARIPLAVVAAALAVETREAAI